MIVSTGQDLMHGERLRPLWRAEFDRLVALGCFEGERIELLRGALVEMSPTDPSHDQSVGALNELLLVPLLGRATVRVQSSYAAADDSEPMPDIVVAPLGEYWSRHPDRAHLIVEVARTSLHKDRGLKAGIYAQAAIDEYWIVDIMGEHVEVLRQRTPDGWASKQVAARGDVLCLVAFPDVQIPVDRILPPRR